MVVLAAATVAPLLIDLLPLPQIPPIVSEIIAGIVIGPVVLDIVDRTAPLQVFASVGLVMLFFLAADVIVRWVFRLRKVEGGVDELATVSRSYGGQTSVT